MKNDKYFSLYSRCARLVYIMIWVSQGYILRLYFKYTGGGGRESVLTPQEIENKL